MKQLNTVRMKGIQPVMLWALMVADSVYREEVSELVVTSVTDGQHMHNSLHYCGEAVDIRLPPRNHQFVADKIARRLGPHYDVILEEDHIHIEHDPQ